MLISCMMHATTKITVMHDTVLCEKNFCRFSKACGTIIIYFFPIDLHTVEVLH